MDLNRKSMFSFFKNKKSNNQSIDSLKIILKQVLAGLKDGEQENSAAIAAIDKGAIKSIKPVLKTAKYNYYGLVLDMSMVNEYQNTSKGQYSLLGAKVWDNVTNSYLSFETILMNGLVMGFALPKETNSFNLNPSKSSTVYVTKNESDEDDSINFLKTILTKQEISFLEGKDIYEVEVDGKVFYHLKDLEDGDFIGIDKSGEIYKLTQDPFEIILIDKEIKELFT